MKIFITGGSGFIGNRLVQVLKQSDCKLMLLTRSKRKNYSNIEFCTADITQSNTIPDHMLLDVDVIVHCAGEVINKNLMYKLHVNGTKNLLESVDSSLKVSKRPIHWIQLSSVGAYGPPRNSPNESRRITEDSLCFPNGEYEITKTLADNLIINFAQRESLFNYTILRPSNVVGESMPNQSFASLISVIKRKLFFYVGSRNSIATYVHVDDVVQAIILSMKNSDSKNQIFNISNDCFLSEIITSIRGNKTHILCVPEFLIRFIALCFTLFNYKLVTKNRVDALVCQTSYPITKISKVLGFSPNFNIPEFASKFARKLY